MTSAQYHTLKTMQTIEDTTGRYPDAAWFDGRVLPGLVRRGWAERDADGHAYVSAAGHRALKADNNHL